MITAGVHLGIKTSAPSARPQIVLSSRGDLQQSTGSRPSPVHNPRHLGRFTTRNLVVPEPDLVWNTQWQAGCSAYLRQRRGGERMAARERRAGLISPGRIFCTAMLGA